MPRLYGFEDMAYRRLREPEAAALRQAASRRLVAQSYPAITDWMNAEGHRTTRGGMWRPAVLANVLDHPAIAGLTEDENGELVGSGGPQIITPEEFLAIRALRPSNAPDSDRAEQREYLLTGGASVCGLCTKWLDASPSNSGARGYRCSPSTRQHPGGCGKVRVNADLLETYVAEHVLAELAKPEVQALLEAARDQVLGEVEQLRKDIEAAHAQQKELGEDYARRQISKESFKTADRELSQSIRDAEVRVRRLEQVKNAPLGGVSDLVRWWKHAPLRSKKGLVVLMLEQVVVYPAASRGSRTVDSDRVALHWRSWTQVPA
ncbi:hypothetical protein GCM10010271_22350 [Streptomyces kurssanovii]|nr:hypothetical protein GCM10010271_22350 [Streptomyces kurssanovii]